MAARYSDALDARVEFARFWLSPKGKELLEGIARGGKLSDWQAKNVKAFILPPLVFGETFYWSPEICRLIFTAAESIPRTWTLASESVDTLCGFAWLATPFPGVIRPIRAVAWVPITNFETGERAVVPPPYQYNPLLDDSQTNGLAITFFSEVEKAPLALPLTILNWQLGKDLTQPATHMDGEIHHEEEAIEKMSLFATMMAFLQQRILIAVRHTADRSARHRAEKAIPKPASQEVQVIVLRKAVYKGGGHRDVEWACQWIVGGHWRNQWYPSKHEYRPKYIASYVKGPEDKPLRNPGRLFAVVR
jgi:hypothetical protein